MSKKGVSVISGNISPIVGEKYTYHILEWYPDTPKGEKNPAYVTWELFKKRKNGRFTTTHIKKKGISSFTFGQKSVGNTYRLEGYLYEPEGGGLIITPKPNTIPKINKVELHYVDDSKGSTFSFMEKLRAKAHCVNMGGKELIFTLWEDDAKGAGHNPNNLYVDTAKAKVDKNGIATVEFTLTKGLMTKAMRGEHDGQLEFYVTVEYYKGKHHDSNNVNVHNPIYKTPPKHIPNNPPHPSTPPVKPAPPKTIPKAKDSPAEQKPPSKKEEKGVLDTILDALGDLWDHAESKGTATKDKQPTQPKTGKSPVEVKKQPENIPSKICECEQNRLVWGNHPKVSCRFRKKIISISKELWPDDFLNMANNLMTIIAFETSKTFNPSIQNAYGFTGLIQFGAAAAGDVGTTTDKLKKMTDIEQLEYVKAYFSLTVFSGKIKNITDMYLAVNYPTMIKTDKTKPNDILYGAPKESYYRNPALMYEEKNGVKERDNRPFGKKEKKYGFKDGKTYVWEITAAMNEWKGKGTELIFVKNNNSNPIKIKNDKSNAVVVTDAGHGIGGDPGNAKKGNPDNESKMTLMVETETANALKSAGINVVRTRTVENLTGVGEQITYRVKVAKKNNAKIFISHHLDYVPINKDGSINQKGAKTTNKIGINIHPTNLTDKNGNSINGGASADFYRNSYNLANLLVIELKKVFTDRDVVIKLAKRPNISHDWLGVLKNMDGADRAATLIELGNTTEENTNFLGNNKQKIGKAISDAVTKYLNVVPDETNNTECENESIPNQKNETVKESTGNCKNCNEDHFNIGKPENWVHQSPGQCWAASVKILKNYGINGGSSANRIIMANQKGDLLIPVDTQKALDYINSQLEKGKPIVVGLDDNLRQTTYNTHKATDHFVVIIGKGCENDKRYYSFYDVGAHNKEAGTSDKNKLYLLDNKLLQGKSSGGTHNYTVTEIRKNN